MGNLLLHNPGVRLYLTCVGALLIAALGDYFRRPSPPGPAPVGPAAPDIHWDDERHATVYYHGRIWEAREDELSDWLIFVRGRAEPVHRITSGGYSAAFRWIAGLPRS